MSRASRALAIAVWGAAGLAPVGAALTLAMGRFPEPYDWAVITFLLSVALWLLCAPIGVVIGLEARRRGEGAAGLVVSLASAAVLLLVVVLLFAGGVLGSTAG